MASTTVNGTVNRIFASKGFSVKETWSGRDGHSGTRYWSVFVPDGQPVTVAEGDTVKVSGLLGTKVSTRDARYVDHTVSNAVVEVTGDAPARDYEPAPPSEDPWATQHQWETTPIPDETPF